MTHHDRFEWDERKAAANLQKHRISFLVAARALADPFANFFHLDWLDDRPHHKEMRWITLASDPYNRAKDIRHRLD